MYQKHKEKLLSFYERQKRMPSYAEAMLLFGFRSKNAVHKLINKFVDEGLIEKDEKGRITPASNFFEIPLLGLVEAGVPSMAEADVLDSISVNEYLIEKKEKTFLLEVKGDSMIEAHITEGDYVIAEHAEDGKDGDIVIAEVDGEWTMKFLKKEKGKTWLEPANKNYKSIHPTQSLRISAIVRGVIRRY